MPSDDNGRGARSLGLRAAFSLLGAFLAFGLAATPALSDHTQTSTFDGSDTDAGAFGELQRLAAHQGSGTVFAIDSGNQVVDRFDSSGTAEAFSATGSSSLGDPGTGETWDLGADSDVAVDSSGTASDGRLYVLSAADFGDQNVFAFDAAGNHLFTIDGDPTVGSGSDICGVAVDPGGDLWVSDFSNSQVVEFDSSGSATGNTVDTSGQGNPCHSAIDISGNLYVAMWQGPVHKYELASGSHLGQVDPDPTFSVAVDPSNDHVFAVHSDRVSEYDASGAAVSEFGSSELTSAVGGAALGSSGDVYVSDQDDDLVHVFSPPAPAERTQTATFDGSDTDAGAFASLQRLAVHQGSGTVFAIDSGNQVVDRFDSSGTAEAFSATGSSSLGDPGTGETWDLGADSDVTVDSSGTASDGNLYVLSAADFGDQNVFAFDSAGNHLFTIAGDPTVGSGSDICGVAVDPGGDLWVSDFANSQVVEFDSSGSATGNTVDTSGQGNPCHSAIDTAGDLYVAMWQGPVHKYELASGSHLGQVDPDPTFSVAVDPSNDHVFAVHSDRVSEYDASGAAVSEFGSSELTSAVGGAALGSSGDVYVSDQDDDLVHVFGFDAPPTARKQVVSEFGTNGTAEGQFDRAAGVAVNQPSGDVYVADRENNRVQHFDSDGNFIRTWGWGVDTGASAFEVCTSSCQAGLGGSGDGQFDDPLGIAIDPADGSVYVSEFRNSRVQKFTSDGAFVTKFGASGTADGEFGSLFLGHLAVHPTTGDVYVADNANARIQRFDSTGTHELSFGSAGSGDGEFAADDRSPMHLAIDSAGTVYANDRGNNRVQAFASDGTFQEVFASAASPAAIAVDPATDNLLVTHNNADATESVISELDSSGSLVETHGAGDGISTSGDSLPEPMGLGANGSSGRLYLSEHNNHRVLVLAAVAAEAPTAAIAPVSDITSTTATFNGSVNPGGASTSYHFEYRPAGDPDWSGATNVPVPDADAGSGGGDVAVSEAVTGLDPGTEYLVRLVATNSEGTATSAEEAFRTPAPPTATIDPASEVTADGATFAGTVNPGGSETSWRFEYRPASDPDWSDATRVPVPDGDAGSGSSDVAVSEQVTGLEAGTDYLVRLVATSSEGTATSAEEAFTTEPTEPPTAQIAPASHVFATQATFNGQVNPGGAATSWHFEYRPAADPDWSNATSVPVPDADAGGGVQDVAVAKRVGGLEPSTDYLVRLVATSSEGTDISTVEAFRTLPPSDLADRGYEQVTPTDKGDAAILLARGEYTQVSSSGDRIFFRTRGALPGSESAQVRNHNMARRGAAGWSTTPLDPPLGVEFGAGSKFHAFTPDLSTGLLTALDPPVLVEGEPRGVQDLFLRETASGDFSLVTGVDPVAKNPALTSGITVFWASRELGHVLLDPQGSTRYFAEDTQEVFYHADAATGEVTMPAFVPDESTADPDDELRVGTDAGTGEAVPGAGMSPRSPHWRQGAISEDGSRVFFTALGSVSGSAPGDGVQLFVRKGRGTPGAHTVRVSAPEPGASDPTGLTWPAWFRAASADGSRVFFTSCQRLTADSTADAMGADSSNRTCSRQIGTAIGRSDLYMFDVDADGGAGDLVDLTGTEMTVNDDPSVPADVWGFVGAAEDGSRAYFVALGNLTADASGEGPKLYAWEEGSGLSLVATLDPALPVVFEGGPTQRPQSDSERGAAGDSRVWLPPSSANKEARVSPDGRFLAFSSVAPLEPGFESADHSQVYLYDAVAEELVCASCVGSGPAEADATLRTQISVGSVADVPTAMLERRNLADDGSVVFFDTAAGLVTEDANGNVDAYGFDAESREAFLLSSGNRGHRATFTNASADGSDAFFKTRERLVASDVDDRIDIYDARVGGGFPAPPPTPAEDCGFDCQGEPAEPPAEVRKGSRDLAVPGTDLDRCRLLGERRIGLHRRTVLRQLQARRLAFGARRSSGPRAVRLARRARLVHRRARLLHRHELRLAKRVQRCAQRREK